VTPGAIDLHAHFLPERYRASALAHGQAHPDGMPALPQWSAAAAIAVMDDAGIAAAALSLSSPGVAFLGSVPERAALARAVNQDGAETVAAHPGRFALLATLPLPDTGAALAELDYAFTTLHADGVSLHTHYDGTYLGDARLDPVMAALDAQSALVTIHPVSPCGWEAVSFGRPRPVLEFLFDTTRAVINLALSGVLDRYPSIRWVIPHAGAALPVIADRVDNFQVLFNPPGEPPIDMIATLGRLHYDLAGVPLPRALPALLSLVSPAQLVYGSDYPFTPAPRVRELATALSTAGTPGGQALAAVLRRNALLLLPALRPLA
jgi:predicted TIM-barrel fold metal-dependent hydrolase